MSLTGVRVANHSRLADLSLEVREHLVFDLAMQHVALPVVPIHLEVSLGSAFEAGQWTWPLANTPMP